VISASTSVSVPQAEGNTHPAYVARPVRAAGLGEPTDVVARRPSRAGEIDAVRSAGTTESSNDRVPRTVIDRDALGHSDVGMTSGYSSAQTTGVTPTRRDCG